jgi:phospholipid/cholesterol/gamma-HCH transport system substrate-binding protein
VRRNQKRGLSPFTAGLIALALVFVATYLGFTKRLPWQGDWELHAVFRSANELHPGSPVRIAGVNVGKVTDVGKGPAGTALVTMSIENAGRPLHADATLKIRPRIFLEGNFFVDIRPGSPSAPDVQEGGTIPVTQTATPVQLDKILSTLTRSTRGQLKVAVREYGSALSQGGAQGLNRSFPYWEGAFKGAAQTAQAIRGAQPGDLQRVIRASGAVAAALASHDRQLADLVTQLERTTGALASEQSSVSGSLRGLASVTRVTPPSLRALDRTFPDVRAFVAEVRPGLRAAPKTLDLALPLLRQLALLVRPSELPALAADLRPTARSLAALEPKLVALLDRVKPVTDCVQDNALPVLTSSVDDPPHTTGRPVWQELLHGLVGLASASQDFDGNGTAVRYHGGYGDQLVSTGQVPGVGQLFGLAPSSLLGSRPAWPGPGKLPPFRPDVPCRTQDRPNLGAKTAPVSETATAGGRAVRPSQADLRPLLRDLHLATR